MQAETIGNRPRLRINEPRLVQGLVMPFTPRRITAVTEQADELAVFEGVRLYGIVVHDQLRA